MSFRRRSSIKKSLVQNTQFNLIRQKNLIVELQEAKKSMKDISIKGLRKLAGWCDTTLSKIIKYKF